MPRLAFLFGAGASYGAGDIIPGAPPLGAALFERLSNHFRGSWGALPDQTTLVFENEGFEAGMGDLYEKYTPSVPQLMREMAVFLIQFRPNSGNTLYGHLIDELLSLHLLDDSVFCTLNYDCVFEFELLRRNLTPKYFINQEPGGDIPVWKLHGSCNWFSKDVKAGSGITYGKGIVWEGGVEASLDIGEVVRKCLVNQGLAPVMSLYMEGKPLQVSPSVVAELQRHWATALEAADLAICIGVRPWPADRHIWDPVARTPANLFFIGDPKEFAYWSKSYRTGPSEHLHSYFGEGFQQLRRRFREYAAD